MSSAATAATPSRLNSGRPPLYHSAKAARVRAFAPNERVYNGSGSSATSTRLPADVAKNDPVNMSHPQATWTAFPARIRHATFPSNPKTIAPSPASPALATMLALPRRCPIVRNPPPATGRKTSPISGGSCLLPDSSPTPGRAERPPPALPSPAGGTERGGGEEALPGTDFGFGNPERC